ncbi:MAG: hypothetical protein J6F30_09680 [Cellulosilyticum sp.]|nr:hypothetical protein [Cellulosilyticum sp.]
MGKGVSRRISGGSMADAIADVSKDKVRGYQSRLDTLADDADFGTVTNNQIADTLNSMASDVRADQELSEEDRRMMNQRIRRMRERYL